MQAAPHQDAPRAAWRPQGRRPGGSAPPPAAYMRNRSMFSTLCNSIMPRRVHTNNKGTPLFLQAQSSRTQQQQCGTNSMFGNIMPWLGCIGEVEPFGYTQAGITGITCGLSSTRVDSANTRRCVLCLQKLQARRRSTLLKSTALPATMLQCLSCYIHISPCCGPLGSNPYTTDAVSAGDTHKRSTRRQQA
jgi:hypothetical protein